MIAMKNRTLAIPAVAAERPEKPKKPAMTEITKKISAHFNNLFFPSHWLPRWGARNRAAKIAEQRQSSGDERRSSTREAASPAQSFVNHQRTLAPWCVSPAWQSDHPIQPLPRPRCESRRTAPDSMPTCSKLTCSEATTQRCSGCLLTRPSWRHMQRRWREKQHRRCTPVPLGVAAPQITPLSRDHNVHHFTPSATAR